MPREKTSWPGSSGPVSPIDHKILSSTHKRRIRQKRRQRSSLLFGGQFEYRTSHLAAKDDLKKSFWNNIYFGSVLFSYFSFNHPGVKSLVRHRIESVLSTNQQRHPWPSLLSDCYSMIVLYNLIIFL